MTQLQALALSVAVEVPCLLVLGGWARRRGQPAGSALQIAGTGLLATALTHPCAWPAMAWMRPWIESWWLRAGLVEMGVVMVEAVVLSWLLSRSLRVGAVWSAAANAASFGAGLVWVAVASLAPSCPPGFVDDAPRKAAIEALVGHRVHGVVCFGEVRQRGLRDPRGRYRLDASTSGPLLAARVAHLEHHVMPDGVGPGCERRLRREEAVGWTTELWVRRRLRVDDPTCPVEAMAGDAPSVERVEAWLETSSHATARALRHSHRRRCDR